MARGAVLVQDGFDDGDRLAGEMVAHVRDVGEEDHAGSVAGKRKYQVNLLNNVSSVQFVRN